MSQPSNSRSHDTTGEYRVENLRRQARRLWNTEPSCDSTVRTTLLSRLASVEYELERLHYRTLEGFAADRAELDGLRAELEQLQARWRSGKVAA